MNSRNRKIYSIKDELIKKSQESALAAIQIFNNPLITFKAESFIVLMNIAWTYFLHAYYREKGVEYRYYDQKKSRRIFHKTKRGAYKYWELERCLDEKMCPLDKAVKSNLKFLIEIRHEIEHQMTSKIDNFISAKFQACCINYNDTIKKLFGSDTGLDKTIPIALQLFSFGENQINQMKDISDLPKNLIDFVADFENELEEKNDPRYSYRVIYLRDNANHKNQADIAYKFIDENSAEGQEIQNVLVKERKYSKLMERQVVEEVQKKGYVNFKNYDHQLFWKTKWKDVATRNNEAKKYGELVMKNIWLWYKETWLNEVLNYCKESGDKFIKK
jgi:hypothetical protein